MSKALPLKPNVKIGDAAKILGVSIDTLRRWEKKGKLEAVRTPGGTRLYNVKALQKIIGVPVKPRPTPSLPTSELLKKATQKISPLQPVATEPVVWKDLPEPVTSEESWLHVFQPVTSEVVLYLRRTSEVVRGRIPNLPIPPKNLLYMGGISFAVAAVATGLFLLYRPFLQQAPKSKEAAVLSQVVGKDGLREVLAASNAVLAASASAGILEINTNVEIGGTLNGLNLIATSGSTLNVLSDVTLDQDVSTTSSPTFESITLSNAVNQIGGNTITFPSATTTLVGTDTKDTLTNKTMSGSSNTFTDIPNSALTNHKVTITAGTNLTGGGAVELGKSITISAKDSPSFSGQVLLSDGTASAPGLAFANDTNTGLYRIGADNISLITGGTAGQGITIDASGNVGLNTITPTTKLHVVGTGNITGAVTIGGTLGVTGATTLSSTLAINGNTTIGDASGDTITFNADAWTLSNDTNVTLSGGVNGLSFDTTTLSIDASNDRVGIGTTSPNQALEVIGSGRFSSTLQLADGTNASPAYTFTNDTNTGLYRIDTDRISFVTGGASRLSINSSGNVGIGTTDPATALEVIGAGTISDDLAVNGGDITTSATTFNLINATATTLNIGGAATSIIAGATNGAFDIRGNLGIGTSSPGARLSVAGGGLIGYTGTEAAPVNGLAVSGNVGIGTTSPNYKLEIVGNTNITGNLTVGGTTSPASAILLSDGSSSTPALSFASDTDTGLYRASSDNMRLVTGGMDRITINSAGNVGIGVTSPATAFHVGGITTVNNKILAGAGSLDIGSSAIRFGTGYFDTVDATNLAGTVTGGSTSNASWTINSDNATNDAEDASLAFERGTGADTVPNAVLGWDSSTHTTTNGKEFDLNSRLHITGTIRSYSGILLEGFENDITTATNEHLAIMPQGTGNVGIGTTGPGSTLQINGNTVIGFGQNTTAAPSNGLAVSGNVGIGSSSPSYKLEVVGTSHFTGNSTFDGVLQLADGTNAAPSLTFLNDTNTGLYRIDTDRMSLVTGGASALTINSSGNVGIGTTAPTNLLSVAGAAAIGSGYAAGSPTTPTNGLIVQGNVGIGTSTPNVALQLVGATALGWAGAPVITAPTSGLAVNGNVGIGTTVAGASLQVNGNVVIGYSSASTAGPTNGLAVLGNVGIGTTSPQYNLHVVGTTNISGTTTFNGTLQLADGSLTAPSLAFTNDTDTGLFRFGSNGLALTTGGSGVNLLSLNSSGNVGIGTTGPAQALEVRGTARIGSNLTNYIEIAGAAAGSATTITSGPGAVALTLTAGTSGNSDLTLSGSSNTYATFNAESLTIPTTGADRGIAITASGTNADIELRTGGGNGVIYQALRSTDNTAFFMVYRNTGDLLLQVLNNGRLRSDVADPATVTNWSVSAESIFRDFGSTIPGTLTITSGFSGQRFNAFGAPTITAASALTVTNAATVYIAGAPIAAGSATITNSAALVIASGNVGIGYTAPVQTLHVQGTEYISGNLGVGTSSPGAKLSVAGGGLIGYTGTQVAPSNGLAILGNVGIGTTSPAYNLQVVGTTNITGASTFGGALQLADGTNSAPSLTFANDTNTGLYRIDTDRMSLVTGGASALTINSSGNVGIGNTNPGGSLIVNSGNVGIGTNSPVARLDVRGAVLINQTSLISDKVLDVAGEAQIDNYLHIGTNAENFGNTASLLELSHSFNISAGAHTVGVFSFPTRTGATNAGIFHAAYVASARIDTSSTVNNVLQYWAGNPVVAGGGTITNSYGLYVENMTSGTNDFGVFVVGADTAAGYFGGNVGIGNSSPGASLQIHGNGVIGYGVNSVAGPSNGLAVFGNVGIGTTSPAYKLEVVGTAHFTGAATYDAGVSYGGNLTPLVDDTYDLGSNTLRWRDLYLGPGTMHIGTSTSDEYSLSYDTTNNRLGFNVNDSANAEIVFDSSGNVGIGTTGPLGLLHVGSSATAPGLVVTSGGNVGIGFSSPQATLDVRGVIFANDGSATAPSYSFNADTDTGLYRRGANGIAITTGGAPLALFSTTTMQLGTDIINGVTDLSINGRTVRAMVSGGAVHINDSATAGTDGDYVQLAMRAADAAGTRTAIRFQGDGNANLAAITSITQTAGQAGHLIFQTSPSGVGGNLTERIRIQHDGNVGIGTSAPTSLFSVAGTTAIGLGYASGSPTAPSNGLIVQGNVGIGTSTPGATLQIAGNQVIGFGAAPAVTGPTNGLAVGGNLGVGNSNPLQRLHVNQSETTSFIVSSAGNVGIGTTSPTAALSFGSTSTINTLSAGNLTLQTGAGTGSGAGGTLALTGGAGGATGTGGAITLTTGAGGGTSGNSGALSLTTGSVTSGTSGAITINPGAVGNAQTGGAVTITGGDVTPDSGGSGTTGSVTIRAGDVAKVANTNVSASGSVTITGGRGISNGTGGAVTIQGGPHWAYNGSLGGGGGLTLAGGDADTSAGQANGAESDGGTVTLRGGTGWSGPDDDGTGAGGTLSITGGTPGVIGAGGAITLATGPGGTTSGNSGDLTLRTGSITSGTAGNIYFQTNGTNLRMTVANGGNVGVGTSAPIAKLHVEGQCVAVGTKIRRRRKKNGKWVEEDVPVEDIEPGDEVLSLNEKTGKFEWHTVEKTMDMGIQDVYRLETEDGKWIETTANHPYLTKDGWKKVSELTVGTAIATFEQNPLKIAFLDETGIATGDKNQPELGVGAVTLQGNGNERDIFNQELRKIFVSALDILEKREEIFEFKFTYVTKSSLPLYKRLITVLEENKHLWNFSWTFAKQQEDTWTQYLQLTRSLFDQFSGHYIVLADHLDKPTKNNNTFSSIEEGHIQKAIQIDSQGAILLQVADILLGSIAFIRAGRKDKIKKKLARIALRLLKTTKKATVNSVYVASLETLPQKSDSVKRVSKFEEIVSIKKVGTKKTYDLQIANTHNFVGNGIVAHNTYISGNLGIGTSSPGARLAVAGGGLFGYLGTEAAPTNGLAVFGNVGIGTTSPTYNLQVVGTANITGALTVGGATSFAGSLSPSIDDTYDLGTSALRWRDLYLGPSSLNLVSTAAETTTARNWKIGIEENGSAEGNLRFALTGSPDALNINPSGNVGIGTTSPGAKLHLLSSSEQLRVALSSTVYTTFTQNSARLIITANGSTAGTNINSSNAGGTALALDIGNIAGGSGADSVVFGLSPDTNQVTSFMRITAGKDAANDWATTSNRSGYMAFSTPLSNTVSERMRITSGGNIGIGTSIPNSTLQVNGNATIGFGNATVGTGPTNGLAVFGNVGIGTSSPAYNLQVVGTTNITGASTFGGALQLADGTNAAPSLTFANDTNTGLFRFGDNGLALTTGGSGTSLLSLNSAGNVGIGTTNPTGILHVVGGAGTGAPITLTAGQGSATGTGGAITLTSGAGGGTSGASGAITLQVGTPVSGNAGALQILGAAGVASNNVGSTITLTAGNSAGTGVGGAVNITAGGANNGISGAVTITGGTSWNSQGTGGEAKMTGGLANGSFNGGAITLAGGATGAASGTARGGAASLTSGATTAGSTGASGALTLSTGAAANNTGGTAGGASGAVILRSTDGGTSATGNGGDSGTLSISTGNGGAVTTSTGTGGAGGTLSITGGTGGGTNAVTGGAGAAVNITAGTGGAGSTTGGAGGALTFVTGNAGSGGNVNGGALTLRTGTATGTGLAGSIIFQTNGTNERMRIDNAGNVGIGTSTPGSALQIVGAGVIGFGAAPFTAPSQGLVVSGNVGVGTSSPIAKLHVEGQCVTGDTKLRRRRRRRKSEARNSKSETDEWIWEDVRIDEIQPGDEILTLDEETGKFVVQKVEKLMDMGVKEIYTLTTATGKTIRTTANHPYLVAKEKKQAKIAVFIDAANFEINLRVLGRFAHYKTMLSQLKDAGQPVFLGYYGPRFGGVHGEKQKKFFAFLKGLGFHIITKDIKVIKQRKKPDLHKANFDVEIAYDARHLLHDYDTAVIFSGDSDFSYLVSKLQREDKKVIIVSSANTVSRELKTKADVFLDLGHLAFAQEKTPSIKGRGSHGSDTIEVKTSLADILPFVNSGHWTKVSALQKGQMIATHGTNGKPVFERIISIRKTKAEQVYDIQVANTHNFVGNGIVAHNTYISGNLGVGTSSPGAKLSVAGGGLIGYTGTQNLSSGTDLAVFGNVGIGTTSPNAKLEVVGGILAANGSAASPTYSFSNDSDTGIYRSAENAFILVSGGNNTFRVDSSGITGSASGARFNASNDTIAYTFSGATGIGMDQYGSSHLQFYTNSTVGMLLSSTGNVGIGTGNGATLPYAKLQLQGTGTGTGVNLLTTSSAGAFGLAVLDNGNVGIGTTGPTQKLDISGSARISGSGDIFLAIDSIIHSPYLGFRKNGVSKWSLITERDTPAFGMAANDFGIYNDNLSANAIVIATATSNVGIGYNSNLNTKLSINGNVGIGTTSAGASIQINGNGVIGYGSASVAAPTNGLAVFGNVGIGTSSPAYNLQVVGTTNITGTSTFGGALQLADGTNAAPSLTFANDTNTGLYRIDTDRMSFVTGGASALTINSSGNVGIGTTSPTQALVISGRQFINDTTGSGTSLQIQGTSGNTNWLQVGTSASNKLLVNSSSSTLVGTWYVEDSNGGSFAVDPDAFNITGIGRRLDLETSANNAISLQPTGTGNVGVGTATPYARLQTQGTGTGTGVNFLTTSSAGTHGLAVLDNGNVGIGTTGPTSKLAVIGSTTLGGAATDTITLTGSLNSNVNFLDASTGTAYTITGSDATGTNAAGGNLTLISGAGTGSGLGGTLTLAAGTSGTGSAGSVLLRGGEDTGSVNGGGITLRGGDGGTTNTEGGDVTIRGGNANGGAGDGGDVTVTGGAAGTTTNGGAITITTGAGGSSSGPSGALTLATGTTSSGRTGDLTLRTGAATGGNAGDIFFQTNGTNLRMTVAYGGNVGIGTSTPGATLQIAGNSVIGFGAAPAVTGPSNGLAVGGNLGIGNSNPLQRFHVNQSETTSFVVASSGNVGIGTSSPTAALSFGSTSTINTLAAGNLTLQTGAGSGAGAGGTLALTGGAGGATGAGGAITLTSGAGGSTSGASGAVTIGSGTTTSGNSGAVILESASTSGNSNTSGNLTIRTGGATSGSDKSSGSLSISTGDPNGDGNAGPITITAGGAGGAATGDPADITITAGAAGNGAADAGDVILVGGDQSGTTSSRAGGRVSLTGGSGNDAGTGGAVVLTGGDGSLTGAGGAITLTTGAGGSSSGASGALTLASGTTTSGRTGDLTLRSGVATGGLAGDISFQTNGSNIRMTVMGAGNIGIGTSTPGATLQIAGNSVIGFGAAPAVTGPSNGLAVGGNIGVGVTNPAAKLEVLGNLLFTSGATRTISVADQGSSNTAGSQLSVTGAAGNGSGAGGALALTAGAGGATGIGGAVTITAGAGGSSSGAGGALTITAGNATGTNSNGGQLSLVGGRANHTGTTPDLLITGGAGPTSGGGADETGGNVLIQGGGARIGGGGSKGGDVQLLGGGGDGSGAGNAGGDVILTGGSPNTGAGAGGAISITTGAGGSTSGASGALTLASGTTTSGRTGDLTLRSGAATGGNAGDIFFQTNGTNLRMTVAYGGNVGIGTSTPGATLQIAGNQVIGYGGAPTAGPSDGLAVFGNVGVGTTSPNYKLEVIGSINVTGDIYKNGTAYNNPDYAFEQWATGQIALNADKPGASTYTGILSLEDTEAFVRQNFQLPRVASATGIFERGDILLEKVEEAYIHLFDLNRKIASNSAQLSDLSAALTTQTINLGSFSIASSSAGLTISSAGQNLLALDALGNMKLAGTITSEAGAFDVAEDYPATDESIEAGDVVAISETVEGNIEKSSTPYQNGIIGVISTKAGLHLGGEDGRPVALAGRVPVKVTTENGAIKAGDYLTSSSIPGLAMKMTRAGTSIGKALESFSCPTSDICQGTVLTFINVGWHDPTVYFTAGGLQQLAPDATQTLASISLDTEVASDSTQASSSASLNLSDDPLFKDLLTKIDLISSRLDVLQKVVVGTESAELVPASSSAELLAAIEDVQLNASGSAILTGDLTVAGRTTLADVGITGTLNAGLLTINGLGSSINTLAGDLKLQNLALGGIDILAGKIKIDIKGNIVSEGTITAKEVEAEKVTTQKLVITEPVASSSAVLSASTSATLAASAGTVTIKAGQTSIDVETSALTVKSLVFVTPDKPIATSGKVKDATTVTISIPTPTPEDVRVNWWIIN